LGHSATEKKVEIPFIIIKIQYFMVENWILFEYIEKFCYENSF
jgi:hypothetical protein